jgi:dipeptidyl-peptidase-4
MRSHRTIHVATILLAAMVPLSSSRAQAPAPLTLARLTAQPSLFGTAPIAPVWSHDGARIAFAWHDAGLPLRDVWVAAATGGAPTRITDMARTFPYPPATAKDPDAQLAERVAARARGGVTDVAWTPDGRELVFVYRGDLFRVGADGSGLTRLTTTGAGRSELAFSPDGRFLSWLQDGDLWLSNQQTEESAPLTRIGAPPLSTIPGARYTRPDVEISSYRWSPDSRHVAVQIDDRTRVRKIAIPNFLAPDTEIKMVRRDYPGDHDWMRSVGLIAISDGRLRTIELPEKVDRRASNIAWSPDGKRLLVDQHSENAVHRWIYLVTAADGAVREVWHDERETRTTQLWNSEWRADGNAILFISDIDDRHHLYSVPADGGTATRLTRGDWSVVSPGFGGAALHVARASGDLFFVANKKHPGERQVYRMSGSGGPMTQVTTLAGVHQPLVSPTGAHVGLLHSSDVTPPELYVADAKGGAPERRLTTSPPAEFASHRWAQPRYVTFKSRTDGVTLHGRLLEPPDLDRTKKYPVILGPVYAFTARNQWRGVYSAFEQFLATQRGCIGLQVDVRGSSGYGRAFREKLLRDYGGIDIEDLHSGVEYLKTLPYVDGERIGIWGWSYGGLMTTMSLFKKPGVYKAGVAGAPATNVWHATTGEVHVTRLPNLNADVFRRNSAYSFAEGLQDHLMLIHGVVDDIVLFRDSAALAEKLMMLDKNFDFVMLPSSPHAAVQKDYVARFILQKIAEHFDRYLGRGPRPARATSSSQ